MVNDKLLQSLDRIAQGVESISAVMNRPENKVKKAMEIAGYGITILGVVTIADIIRNWIIGG